MASGSASPPAFLSISFVLRVSTKSCCPSLPSPFAAFFLRPAQIACFGLDVQEAQNTAQKKKTGKMREEKQDTLSIISSYFVPCLDLLRVFRSLCVLDVS